MILSCDLAVPEMLAGLWIVGTRFSRSLESKVFSMGGLSSIMLSLKSNKALTPHRSQVARRSEEARHVITAQALSIIVDTDKIAEKECRLCGFMV